MAWPTAMLRVPSGARIRTSVPVSGASISSVDFSVSTSAITWPAWTRSPSATSQATRSPSVIESKSSGRQISIGMLLPTSYAMRSRSARAAAFTIVPASIP